MFENRKKTEEYEVSLNPAQVNNLKIRLNKLKRYREENQIKLVRENYQYTFSLKSNGDLVITRVYKDKDKNSGPENNLVGKVQCLTLTNDSTGEYFKVHLVKTQSGRIKRESPLEVGYPQGEADELLTEALAAAITEETKEQAMALVKQWRANRKNK